ncbi:MAG: acyltransferase family protein [Alphaproteobacteria bacterium]
MSTRPGSWRPDVDGLRGIAVLAVILFHLDAGWVPGGFAGVDVFLAISGYLLTRNVLADKAAGTFSVGSFYRRRVRRIALPMLVVIAAVLAASQLLLLPEDALRTAQAGLWSAAGLANAWFWRNLDTGYFSREAHEAPLLHLWSLGLEEQFYLLWPLLLPLAARRLRSPRALLAAVALLAASSFAAGQAMLARDPLFAFYMLPTRAGGLLLGALAAVAAHAGLVREVDPSEAVADSRLAAGTKSATAEPAI